MNKVLVAALIAASCTLSYAETSAAKKALVDKVLQLQRPAIEMQARALSERPAAAMLQQVSVLVQQRVPLEKREALMKEIQGDLRQYVEVTAPLIREQALRLHPTVTGAILDSKFSEAELKQLVEALDAPAFRKYQQSSDEMFRPLNEQLVLESRSSVEPKLKELDQLLRKRLAAAVGTPAPAAKP